MRTIKLALVMFFSIAIAACGGGGGGGGGGGAATGGATPLAAATITSANEQSVTGAALDSGMGAVDLGSFITGGVQISTPAPNNRVLSRLTATVVQKIAEQRNAPASVTGVVETINCNGVNTTAGTISFDDFNGTTSAKVTFTNCNFGGGEVFNGTMNISGMTQTASSESGTVSLNLTITQTGLPTVTIAGGFTFGITGIGTATETTTMTGTHLAMTEGANSEGIFNFNFSSSYNTTTAVYTDSATFTLSSTAIGGSFTFATVTPFVTNGTAMYPSSGVAHITGAGSTRLHVTVLGNETAAVGSQVKIERSTDGGTTYGTATFTTWAALNL